MDKGITLGNCLLDGLSGLKTKKLNTRKLSKISAGGNERSHFFLPDEVFAERREGLFLIVTEHLEDDGLSLDVLHEGLGHLHCDLPGKREITS